MPAGSSRWFVTSGRIVVNLLRDEPGGIRGFSLVPVRLLVRTVGVNPTAFKRYVESVKIGGIARAVVMESRWFNEVTA
jgi:hypothetical protein